MAETTNIDRIIVKEYQDRLMRWFMQNRQREQNPNGIFFYYFSKHQREMHIKIILEILQRLNRRTILVDCTGLSAMEIYRRVSGTNGNTEVAYKACETVLLNDNVAVVFKDISQSKISHRAGFARSLLKIGDDAHFQDYRPVSDVIFVDSASFLHNGWDLIAPYTKQFGPINSFDIWLQNISDMIPFRIQ